MKIIQKKTKKKLQPNTLLLQTQKNNNLILIKQIKYRLRFRQLVDDEEHQVLQAHPALLYDPNIAHIVICKRAIDQVASSSGTGAALALAATFCIFIGWWMVGVCVAVVVYSVQQ